MLLDPAIRIVSADYERDQKKIRSVRFAVFVDEQRVPAELEMDDRDPGCFHVLALAQDTGAVGTGRVDVSDGGRIGRMAVLATHRNQGIGAALMDALHAHARERGCTKVWCHAQIAAQRFYERAGYIAEGEIFSEAGIDHVTMRQRL